MDKSNLDLNNEINLELSKAQAVADLLAIACTGDIELLKENTLASIAFDLEERLTRIRDLFKNMRVVPCSAPGVAEVDNARPH